MSAEPLLTVKRRGPQVALNAWAARLVLALLLAFASEVMFWAQGFHVIWHWPLVALGYLVLAALLLDAWVRWSVRDIFGALLLAGLYGLLGSLLLHPTMTLGGLPFTLMSRVMGLQVVAGAVALLMLRVLWRGIGWRGAAVFALIGGGFWGTWLRGAPSFYAPNDTPLDALPVVSLTTAGLWALGLLAAALILSMLSTRPNADALRLSRGEWGGVLLVMVGLLAWQMGRGAVSRDALATIVAVAPFAWIVLWFQTPPKPYNLLTTWTTEAAPRLSSLVTALVGWIVVGLLTAWLTPPADGAERVLWLAVVLSAFGLTWLPAVSLVLGVRAYRTQVRTGKLTL